MPIKKYIFLLLLMLAQLGFSQIPELSSQAQIGVITCGAGEELYSTFGHSAFHVQDPKLGINVVYNYGTFNFNPPMFYVDFARGKLLYSLSRANFEDFMYEYELQNRWVKEQVLDLSPKENNALFQFLETNYLPENRDYKYDFLFDNCATKIPAVLKKVFGERLVFKEGYLEDQFTFRELIHQNLITNSWSSFGIDLALGAVIDRKATPYEHTFLPDYLLKQLDQCTLGQQPLVKKESTVLESKPTTGYTNSFTTPLFWISLLLLLVAFITFLDFKKNTGNRWLDFILFFTAGLAGILIVFLWFFTDHSSTANNFNILWAFPTNVVVAFYLFRKTAFPNWMRYYLWGLLGLLLLTVILWILKIQVFSMLILPILLSLAIRYVFLLNKCKDAKYYVSTRNPNPNR